MRSKILQFWQWFYQNEAFFRNGTNPKKAKEMLDNQILSFGKFAWGIDEGITKPYVFTISPNNDKKLLAISKQIIEVAPDLPQWEFQYCKPPLNDWDFTFQAYNQYFILQTLDAAEWKFVLIEEEDYRVSVEIKADNLATLDWEDREQAAIRVITNLLGEALYIKEVHSVKLVSQFDPRDKDWIYSMGEFRARFLYFIE